MWVPRFSLNVSNALKKVFVDFVNALLRGASLDDNTTSIRVWDTQGVPCVYTKAMLAKSNRVA